MPRDASPRFAHKLNRIANGERQVEEELFPWIYDELRTIAHRLMQDEGRRFTLHTTALVHEAWISLHGKTAPDAQSEVHFRRLAARAMRSILVDHARSRNAEKRGSGRRPMPLHEGILVTQDDGSLLVTFDDSLRRLTALDAKLAQIAELRCFSGMTHLEIGQALDLPLRTVERSWRTARAWLMTEMA